MGAKGSTAGKRCVSGSDGIDENLEPVEWKFSVRDSGWTEKDIEDLQNVFMSDYPEGVVTLDEFLRDWSNAIPKTTPDFLQHIFRSFDSNRDGQLDFPEFVTALAVMRHGGDRQKEAWIFRLFDVNGDGVITREEMIEIARVVGPLHRQNSKPLATSGRRPSVATVPARRESLFRHCALAVFDDLDADGNGTVTKREFVCALKDDPLLLNHLALNVLWSGRRQRFTLFTTMHVYAETRNEVVLNLTQFACRSTSKFASCSFPIIVLILLSNSFSDYLLPSWTYAKKPKI